MNSQIITTLTIDDLKAVISEGITDGLQRYAPPTPAKPDDELIKIDAVANMLNVSKVTVFAWKKAGLLPFYRISNKVFFKKGEVIDALKKIERRGL